MSHTTRLLALVAVTLVIAPSCTPEVAAVPCNEDDDCAGGESCMRGVCSAGSALPLRPDAGVRHDDAGDPPVAGDGGVPSDDGGTPSGNDAGSDAGSDAGVPGDGGSFPDDGGGAEDDGGEPLDDGGALPVDAGPDPVLDAGPPGIASFTAEPPTASLGESVTLTWETRGVTSCTLEGTAGTLAATGSLVVERPASRPYLLSCKGEDGEGYEAEVVVEVTCPGELELPELIIASDDELAAFPSGACVTVTGDVVIENLTRTDLLPLYGLRSVGGTVAIGGDLDLQRLDGLELLHEVGDDLRLGYQELDSDPLMVLPALVSVHGLSALERVGLDLEILGAASLTSLAGLERVVSVGDDLEAHDNPLLQSLDGLKRLESIGNDLELTNAPALTRLGFGALESLDGGLVLSDVGLTGLGELSGVHGALGVIYVHDCDSLVSLAGLEGITGADSYLTVQYNAALSNLDGLSGLARAERVVVRRNPALLSANLPALQRVDYTGPQGCSGDYCDGDLAIESNAALVSVDNYPALSYVRRNLRIASNGQLLIVAGFDSLTAVNNDFIVSDNDALTRIAGFGVMTTADDVFVEGNGALTTLSLPALAAVDDDVELNDNDALLAIDGLDGLEDVGGNLEISGNASLTSLTLPALTGIGDYPSCSRGCVLSVTNNPNLPGAQAAAIAAQGNRPLDADDEANVDVTTGNGS